MYLNCKQIAKHFDCILLLLRFILVYMYVCIRVYYWSTLQFMQFLEKLGSIAGLDEVSRELGFDLQTDALLARAEQLTKLEGDRLADRVQNKEFI